MIEIINAIVPVFSIIVAGFIIGKIRFLEQGAATILNRFIFYLTLPALLFHMTATARPEDLLQYDFALVFMIGSLMSLVLGIVSGKYLFKKKDSKEIILHTMTITLGNTAYLCIPMLLSLFGTTGGIAAVVGTITVNMPLTAVGICMLQIVCYKGKDNNWHAPFINIIKMPFITASIIGMACTLLEIKLPLVFLDTAKLFGSPTMAAALFAVGLSLADLRLHKATMLEVSWVTFAKLIISPLLVLLVCPLFPSIDPVWKSCAVLLAASPLASTVCVVSANFNSYVEETSSTAFISTLLSVLTLPLFIHWLT